jgi:hypothetical protein
MTTTLPAPPDRTLQQRMDALGEANRIRFARSQLKRDLKAGRRHLVDLLRDPPEYLDTMKVLDLLLATPRIGRVKALTALNACRVSPTKTIGGLTERQLGEIVGHMNRPPR